MLAHVGVVEHGALIALIAVATWTYWRSWDRDRTRSLLTLSAWAAAMVTLLVATSPLVESAAGRSFTGHMVQHLLMIVVVAPLVSFAEPVAVLRRAVQQSGRRVRVTAVERRLARRWRSTGPLVAPAVFIAVLFVTHLTGIYDRALENPLVHHLEHVAYLGSAVLLWSVVRTAGQVDAVRRIGTVFAVIAGSALLGVVLISANAPLVATYEARLGPTLALSDQRAAASLMWVGGMATSLPLLILAFWQWASTEERIARRSEELSNR